MDDCARLENVFTREGNGGSNPFLSAETENGCKGTRFQFNGLEFQEEK